MHAAVRALLTAITVAALTTIVLTAPAVAGVPAPGEQPPHRATTEHPTVPQAGFGAQFDRDEFTPPTGSQPTTDDYALVRSIPALAVTLLGLSLMVVGAGSTRRRRRRPRLAAV
jgi:hypothetical protein